MGNIEDKKRMLVKKQFKDKNESSALNVLIKELLSIPLEAKEVELLKEIRKNPDKFIAAKIFPSVAVGKKN